MGLWHWNLLNTVRIGPANGGVVLAIGTLSEPSSDKVPINGSDKQKAILERMTGRDSITTAELATQFGISQRGILKILNKLEDAGLIVRTGKNRSTKYSLANKPEGVS